MDTNTIHRNLHNSLALLALLTLVGLSSQDFHNTFCSFCTQHNQEIGTGTPSVFTYVLVVAYACLFYCELQMHNRKGASAYRIVLHLVTLVIALLPHLLVMYFDRKLSDQTASIVNIEMVLALVLFGSVEVVLAYLVWHINNPPRRKRRSG